MKLKSVFLVSLLSMSACHHAPSNDKDKAAKDDGVAFPESSSQLSKWVRMNVGDFWTFEKVNPGEMASYTDAVGIVVGDTHLANFGPIPVALDSGLSEMRYLDIDFDDAGRAPFALDFLRLVVTSKATKKDVKVKDMVAAYMNGLLGHVMMPPKELADSLAMTADQYRTTMSEDLNGKVTDTGFKMKPGKIEPYKGSLTKSAVARLLPSGLTLVDLAIRPVGDGEARSGERIWIYAKESGGLRRLFELKQYEPTALSQYSAQASKTEWADEVRGAFWPGIKRGEYELIDIAGFGSYWLREKKLTMIDIPYSATDKKAVAYVRKLAEYDSYYLGTLHARQPSAVSLIEKLRSPIEQGVFQESIKLAAKSYLQSIQARASVQ